MEGGNGKDKPQVPGGVVNPANDPNKVMVLTIYVDKTTNRVEVVGALGNKVLCLNAVAEAIKVIANFTPSPIIQPGLGNRIVNFARNFGRKH